MRIFIAFLAGFSVALSLSTLAIEAQVTTITYADEQLEASVPIRILRMHSHDGGAPDKIVYMAYGSTYLDHGELPAMVAADPNRFEGVAFIELPVLPNSALNLGAGLLEDDHAQVYRALVLDGLMPFVEKRLGFSDGVRHLLGYSAGAVLVLDLAAERPQRFHRAAFQSPGWMNWDSQARGISMNYVERALTRIASNCTADWPATWWMWGDGDDEWEARSRDNGAKVMVAMHGCAEVYDAGTWPGNHGFHLAHDSLDEALNFLLTD